MSIGDNDSSCLMDEAGDGVLFNKDKQITVGREGCSHCFILGVLQVSGPAVLNEALESLRSGLLADPCLAKLPSMLAERRKTAVAFHAKDDCAEGRREVFRLLMQHDMHFFAVVRHKQTIVEKVLQHNKTHRRNSSMSWTAAQPTPPPASRGRS